MEIMTRWGNGEKEDKTQNENHDEMWEWEKETQNRGWKR